MQPNERNNKSLEDGGNKVSILCTSDFHMSERLLLWLDKFLQYNEVDLVINTGDFLSQSYFNNFCSILQDHEVKGIVVEGNWDDSLHSISKNVKVLDLETITLFGYTFFGVNEKIYRDEEDLIAKVKGVENKRTIFLTHEPPHGILDSIWTGASVGNKTYRAFDELFSPLIHCFGHIHERNGVVRRGGVTYINAAMADIQKAYVISLPELKIREVVVKR